MSQFNPQVAAHRKMLEDTIDVDFDEASVELLGEDSFRSHLGASIIGKKCSRQIWYAFRWVLKPDFSSKHKTHGQMLRLFNRGQREEAPVMQIMKKQGFRFLDPPVDPKTGFPGQHRMQKQAYGHMGGSMDAIGYLPEKFNFPHLVLFEFKTANAKSFRETKRDGLKVNKSEHWAQMCTYGRDKDIHYGMYIVVNKDTDEVYFEFVMLNHDLGQDMVNKGEMIVLSATDAPPNRISESAAIFDCKACQFSDICHYGDEVVKNCRSCRHASAIQDGQWQCNLYGNVIPPDFIPKGCDNHEGIK